MCWVVSSCNPLIEAALGKNDVCGHRIGRDGASNEFARPLPAIKCVPRQSGLGQCGASYQNDRRQHGKRQRGALEHRHTHLRLSRMGLDVMRQRIARVGTKRNGGFHLAAEIEKKNRFENRPQSRFVFRVTHQAFIQGGCAI